MDTRQNRFWRLLARLTDEEIPETIEEKKTLLLKHQIAIWDVVHSCDIVGSSDSSIKNVVPCELEKDTVVQSDPADLCKREERPGSCITDIVKKKQAEKL